MYSVKFTKSAEREFEYIANSQPKMANRLAQAIDRLADDPKIGVPLRGELKGLWKYRVGSYRIIYQTYRRKLTIIILDVGHRRDVYR